MSKIQNICPLTFRTPCKWNVQTWRSVSSLWLKFWICWVIIEGTYVLWNVVMKVDCLFSFWESQSVGFCFVVFIKVNNLCHIYIIKTITRKIFISTLKCRLIIKKCHNIKYPKDSSVISFPSPSSGQKYFKNTTWKGLLVLSVSQYSLSFLED